MGFSESVLTALFIMTVVFAVLIILWIVLAAFSKIIQSIEKDFKQNKNNNSTNGGDK